MGSLRKNQVFLVLVLSLNIRVEISLLLSSYIVSITQLPWIPSFFFDFTLFTKKAKTLTQQEISLSLNQRAYEINVA